MMNLYMKINDAVQSPEVIFVQLGGAPCSHLWSNLEQISKNFPQLELTVIVDAESQINAPSTKRWKYWLYNSENRIRKIVDEKSEDRKFRNGFWSFTLERLFAFTTYQQTVLDKPMLHIESDILVLPEFPFSKFNSILKLAWLRVDSNRDVAALIYSPSHSHAKFLENEILVQLIKSKNTTDMHVLNQIRTLHPDKIQVLPSLDLRNTSQASEIAITENEVLHDLSSGLEHFGGIFDPVAIGIWLTGTDPRNYFGTTLYGDTDFILANGSFVNPDSGKYSYSRKNGLIIENGTIRTRVWSLHIHSKDLRIFGEHGDDYLQELITNVGSAGAYKKYSSRVLVNLLRDNYRNHTLIRFLISHPVLRPILSFYKLMKTDRN